MSEEFVHLHAHSEYSLLDGLSRIQDMVQRAAELGQPALALTDHGVMHGTVEFCRTCKGHDIKPLVGVEAYHTVHGRPMGGTNASLDRHSHHLLLLAKNDAGYRNLMKLTTDSHLRGFYYRPRVDHDYLAAHAEGVICTSGCLSSEIPSLLMNGREDTAEERLLWYLDVFNREHFYIELQQHEIPELARVNRSLLRLARKHQVKLVATNDVHYVRQADSRFQDVLLCVQTGSKFQDGKRMRMDGDSFFLRSRQQMEDAFRGYADLSPEVFTNSLLIAEMCNVDPEDDEFHLPPFELPAGAQDYNSHLRQETETGLGRVYGDLADTTEVQERKEKELQIISKMGFSSYFLIVSDLCQYSKRKGIWWNVRGSGNGSIVAFALGITILDPLAHGLIFERFLNPGRISMPDFDLDFPDDQREELIRYTQEKYGEDQVAQIVTFGRMMSRAAVRDVGRVLDVPLSEVDKVAKAIPSGPGAPNLKKLTDRSDPAFNGELAELTRDESLQEMISICKSLEGVARNASVHPAAVIVADKPLWHYTPLSRGSKTITKSITQYEYPVLESLGLLKIDFLGLRTLTILREACRFIRERQGVQISVEDIPLGGPEAAKSFELICSGDTIGLFQIESSGFTETLASMRPSEFPHMVAALSLYRPGPMDYIDLYARCMHGEEEVVYKHELLEPILSETYGIIVYQEQIIEILHALAGYTQAEADLVRSAISKKDMKKIEESRKVFMQGSREQGISKAIAEDIWGDIELFVGYGFNKCLPGDSLILDPATGRRVRIEDAYVDPSCLSNVLAYEQVSQSWVPRRPGRVMWNGVKSILRLETASGRVLEATGNHPILTPRGWVQVEDLQALDDLVVPRSLPTDASGTWTASQLEEVARTVADSKGVSPKSASPCTALPAEIWELSDSCLAYLLVAFFRELGFQNGEVLGWQVENRLLAAQLQHANLRAGLVTRILQTDKGTCWRVILNETESADRFRDWIFLGFYELKRIWRSVKVHDFADPEVAGLPSFLNASSESTQGAGVVSSFDPQADQKQFQPPATMLDQIVSIDLVGEMPTYDLEVPELHNFVADDFIVHNSHATNYATITLQTAYLKARYPLEYMMAMLLVERDRTDRVGRLMAECRRMAIQVLPPNVNASQADFDIQIGANESEIKPTCNFEFPIEPGSAIRFGLAAIKNVSTRAVQEQIVDKRPPQGFSSLEDFCDICSLQEVGRKTLEALIYSGALDNFGNRLQLTDALETMLKRSKASNGGEREFQDSLFGDEEISVPIKLMDGKVNSQEAIRLAQLERELWGHVAGEKSLFEVLEEIGANVPNLTNIEDLTREREGDSVNLLATVVSVRTHTTKKGDRMAFLNVEDLTGQLTVIAFSDAFAQAQQLLQPQAHLVFKGHVRYNPTRGEITLALTDVRASENFEMRTDGLPKSAEPTLQEDEEKTQYDRAESVGEIHSLEQERSERMTQSSVSGNLILRLVIPNAINSQPPEQTLQELFSLFGEMPGNEAWTPRLLLKASEDTRGYVLPEQQLDLNQESQAQIRALGFEIVLQPNP